MILCHFYAFERSHCNANTITKTLQCIVMQKTIIIKNEFLGFFSEISKTLFSNL